MTRRPTFTYLLLVWIVVMGDCVPAHRNSDVLDAQHPENQIAGTSGVHSPQQTSEGARIRIGHTVVTLEYGTASLTDEGLALLLSDEPVACQQGPMKATTLGLGVVPDPEDHADWIGVGAQLVTADRRFFEFDPNVRQVSQVRIEAFSPEPGSTVTGTLRMDIRARGFISGEPQEIEGDGQFAVKLCPVGAEVVGALAVEKQETTGKVRAIKGPYPFVARTVLAYIPKDERTGERYTEAILFSETPQLACEGDDSNSTSVVLDAFWLPQTGALQSANAILNLPLRYDLGEHHPPLALRGWVQLEPTRLAPGSTLNGAMRYRTDNDPELIAGTFKARTCDGHFWGLRPTTAF